MYLKFTYNWFFIPTAKAGKRYSYFRSYEDIVKAIISWNTENGPNWLYMPIGVEKVSLQDDYSIYPVCFDVKD